MLREIPAYQASSKLTKLEAPNLKKNNGAVSNIVTSEKMSLIFPLMKVSLTFKRTLYWEMNVNYSNHGYQVDTEVDPYVKKGYILIIVHQQ